MHQLNSTKRARVTSNAIHLPGSRILHYVRFRYPIENKQNLSNFSAMKNPVASYEIFAGSLSIWPWERSKYYRNKY
jgi:hypothetical protein